MDRPPPGRPTRPLKFIVVGGSVAGLCAAYTLRQSGHNVVVIDKRDERIKTHGGLRVPPNMTRLLLTLPNMDDLFRPVVDKNGREAPKKLPYTNTCIGMKFMQGETGEGIGQMPFLSEVIQDLGCDFYMVPYDVLINRLLALCRDSGVKLKFRTAVTSVVVAAGQRPAVIATRNAPYDHILERYEGDVLVGADGRHSLIRETLAKEQPAEDDDDDSDSASTLEASCGVSEIIGTSYSIPMSALKSSGMMSVDPDDPSKDLLDNYMVWAGPNILFTGHKCGPELYIVSVLTATAATTSADDPESNGKAPLPDNEALLAPFEPRVRDLVNLAYPDYCYRTVQRIPAGRQLVDTSTGMVVIGDAAHTITIHATHNSSLAVEDGFALARVFSHGASPDDIPYLLGVYRDVRYGRTAETEKSELGSFVVITFPPGPARDMRNQQFGAMMGADVEADDEHLRQNWEQYLKMFNYDANEGVEEYFTQWPRQRRVNGHTTEPSELDYPPDNACVL